MRAQDPGKAPDAARPRRTASRIAPAVPSPAPFDRALTPQAAMYALQRSVGNAAATRALQREAHQHSAGCAHRASGRGSVAQIQRDAVLGVLGARGRSLPEPVQREAEGRLKVPEGSYRSVEILDRPRDLAVARALGAIAFTSGKKIVGDVSRKKTLLHELIHVGQQARGAVPGTDMGNGLKLSDKGDDKEREAESGAIEALATPLPTPPRPARPGKTRPRASRT
ncbi:protein of unknown function [Streptomyces sp. DvalAA-14]|uniref:eCIS core domain-containing protein n=1 Tax=unclassified Streptomyces TaxID=2593676 RepID=UPI00081B4BEA|nr:MULTISPECIES: DUF4157 domain-containing protein [unclassified Streptomyces]MYS22469.1 DUF4157 domain-containing protein [Streptomyces sp. SID4948]SCE16886.1 protein of unknown function [Streptomyces sp. DvalAA-14]